MSKRGKRARAKRKTLRQGTVLPNGEIAPIKPKAGPGQTFRAELVDMRSGLAKRFRNIGCSPLTLAFYQGRLALAYDGDNPKDAVTPDERYAAGLVIEQLWQTLHVSNLRDSTLPGISSFNALLLTEAKEEAGRRLHRITSRMEAKDRIIVLKFCGEMWSAPDSLRAAGVPFDRRSLFYRICESLDALVYMTGARLPPHARSSEPTARGTSRRSEVRDANVA